MSPITLPSAPRSFATCPRCEQAMAPGTSCCDCAWHGDIAAIRFGSETWIHLPDNPWCPDCHTPRGGTHHYGCDTEECPHGRQALMCDECPVLEHDPYAQPARLT